VPLLGLLFALDLNDLDLGVNVFLVQHLAQAF
jgi:hypothetical protein